MKQPHENQALNPGRIVLSPGKVITPQERLEETLKSKGKFVVGRGGKEKGDNEDTDKSGGRDS